MAVAFFWVLSLLGGLFMSAVGVASVVLSDADVEQSERWFGHLGEDLGVLALGAGLYIAARSATEFDRLVKERAAERYPGQPPSLVKREPTKLLAVGGVAIVAGVLLAIGGSPLLGSGLFIGGVLAAARGGAELVLRGRHPGGTPGR